MLTPSKAFSTSPATVPLAARSKEDQDLLERNTKKSKTSSDQPRGLADESQLESEKIPKQTNAFQNEC